MKTNTDTGNSYTFGDVVRFGAGTGSERFKQDGWSDTEKEFTWTTGNSAELALSLAPYAHLLNLRMRLTGLTKAPQLAVQPVAVLANGQKIADWEVSRTADFIAVIPEAISKKGGILTIELKTPKAASPKALGMSGDTRVLGVLCSELAITKGG